MFHQEQSSWSSAQSTVLRVKLQRCSRGDVTCYSQTFDSSEQNLKLQSIALWTVVPEHHDYQGQRKRGTAVLTVDWRANGGFQVRHAVLNLLATVKSQDQDRLTVPECSLMQEY